MTPTMTEPSAAPSHHQRARYAARGKSTTANLAISRHAGTWAPVTALRARATLPDSSAVSTASPPADLAWERCVVARW